MKYLLGIYVEISNKQLEIRVWSSGARMRLETNVLNCTYKEVLGLNEITQRMN